MPRSSGKEDFEKCREFYTNRLHRLRSRLLEIGQEARTGRRDPDEALEDMRAIGREVRGITECGKILRYLHLG